jgi:hypothetical protein
MNRPRQDTAFRPNRPRSHELSTPQLRALRKELLIVRASVERAELAETIVELRETVTHFSWLKFLVPGFGRARSVAAAGAGIGSLLKQYPLLSSIASLIVAKPLRSGLVSAAFTAWEAWRVWQQIRRSDGRKARAAAPDDTADAGY